jgi:hypothetical protein
MSPDLRPLVILYSTGTSTCGGLGARVPARDKDRALVPEKGYPHVSAEVSASLGRRTSVPARFQAELTELVIDIKRALIASGNLDQGTVSPHGGGDKAGQRTRDTWPA